MGQQHVTEAHRDSTTTDLATRSDISLMVRRFYTDVAQDHLLGPVFAAAEVDWADHIPKLTDYWCRFLVGTASYAGNPSHAHAAAHRETPFTSAHFERWLELFESVIDEGWTGPNADRTKLLARRIASAQERYLAGVAPSPRPARRACTVT